MTRTLGTINTNKGIAALIHDDQSAEFTANYPDGTSEHLGDYYPTKSWRAARKQAIAWYANTVAYHDSWVLCLRPIRTLQLMKSEEQYAATTSDSAYAPGAGDVEVLRG